MKQEFTVENDVDQDGTPAGGFANGLGMMINWQQGALSVDGERKEPNGAFVETVIAAALQRIEHYQTTEFACSENAAAIEHLEAALQALDDRTKGREARGVEGTHEL